MKKFCFSVDVDRDANECMPGNKAAVSSGGGVRFTSSEKGLDIILDMLDDIGMKATFFAEARTLENIDASFGDNEIAMHGLDHEDMTGELSGIRPSDEELRDIMGKSKDIIKDRTGIEPKGFRAPYMKTDGGIMDLLPEFGIIYDSSVYAEIGTGPYVTASGISEIPVPVSEDRNGRKIYGYLWPMHEGRRGPEDYTEMADSVDDGIFALATHSWHITESVGGPMDGPRIRENIENVRKVLTAVLDKGFRSVRMIDCV
jgi:peptidoglycan/xylan/chitin deacetylase (PgdA/CDA1 family)